MVLLHVAFRRNFGMKNYFDTEDRFGNYLRDLVSFAH